VVSSVSNVSGVPGRPTYSLQALLVGRVRVLQSTVASPRVTPTTMIFVPCAGGISHNEAESTSFDECAAGAQVLLESVLAYDRRLGG